MKMFLSRLQSGGIDWIQLVHASVNQLTLTVTENEICKSFYLTCQHWY